MNKYDGKTINTPNTEDLRTMDQDSLDSIRGCIFGGAVGDALGYSIEFLDEEGIFKRYGLHGITVYDKDIESGEAIISDDTQMTLFTANGLLVRDTICSLKGIHDRPRSYVSRAYHDWLLTQDLTWHKAKDYRQTLNGKSQSWLLDVPELYERRAPGITCLNALRNDTTGIDDFVKSRKNNSKGCGGVMRVAPMAVNDQMDIEELDMEGAQIAAITHGHSLGYMPAAVLVHIINRIIFPPKGYSKSLKEIIIEARDTVVRLFDGDQHLSELVNIIDRAVQLSEDTTSSDLDNIHKLGEGWVAEETLAIALYCALRHQNDFSAGVIAAVNHKGDSDSTGAVAGNILGALHGYQAIEEKWKKDLELSDVILEIADDLCHFNDKILSLFAVDNRLNDLHIIVTHIIFGVRMEQFVDNVGVLLRQSLTNFGLGVLVGDGLEHLGQLADGRSAPFVEILFTFLSALDFRSGVVHQSRQCVSLFDGQRRAIDVVNFVPDYARRALEHVYKSIMLPVKIAEEVFGALRQAQYGAEVYDFLRRRLDVRGLL